MSVVQWRHCLCNLVIWRHPIDAHWGVKANCTGVSHRHSSLIGLSLVSGVSVMALMVQLLSTECGGEGSGPQLLDDQMNLMTWLHVQLLHATRCGNCSLSNMKPRHKGVWCDKGCSRFHYMESSCARPKEMLGVGYYQGGNGACWWILMCTSVDVEWRERLDTEAGTRPRRACYTRLVCPSECVCLVQGRSQEFHLWGGINCVV